MIPFYITPTDMSLAADLIWPDQTPPSQGKRHRAQLAAAKRTTPQSNYESRQARRARERRERMPHHG